MKKNVFLSVACIALCAGALLTSSGKARAQEVGSLSYYSISEEDYRNHYYEWKLFLEYHLNREPCQHYREPPAGYVMKGCDVYREGTALSAIQPRAGEVTETTVVQTEPPPVMPPTETIYFDFDKSNIRETEQEKLDRLISRIRADNATHITVSGHADTSGSADYNQGLSQRRAGTVAGELTSRGISGDVIDEKAYGETMPAVPTGDGVKMQENRRTVIDYTR